MVAEGDKSINRPGRPLGGQTGNRGSALTHLWTKIKAAFRGKSK